jgi:hypothetical protein
LSFAHLLLITVNEKWKSMGQMTSTLKRIISRFDWLSGFVNEEFRRAGSALQDEVASIITDLIDNAMRPIVGQYIEKFGQKGFDKLVAEDKDLLVVIEKYRPSYLFYLNRARKLRRYIKWNNLAFADDLRAYLQEQGISVDSRGYDYLLRTCERFRKRILGS